MMGDRRKPLNALVLALAVLANLSCSESTSRIEIVHAPAVGPGPWPTANTKLIYDGDLGPDPCDFTTLSMLHEYHRRGMIDLVGVIGEAPDPHLASTFSLYNQIYGNEIPIGVYRHGSDDASYGLRVRLMYRFAFLYTTYSNPNKVIDTRYASTGTARAERVRGPVETYRKLLSEAEDGSITLFAAGQLFNLSFLLASNADQYSRLDGEALLKRKVKEFIFMGGHFPASSDAPVHSVTSGAEYNWWALGQRFVSQTTLGTLAKMGRPMTYIGFEIGERLLVGQEVVRRFGRDHPTSDAYYQYRSTYGGEDEDSIRDNPAFDDVALYYLVEGGIGTYFGRVPGRVQIDEGGANTWMEEGEAESYLTLLPGVENELTEVITDRITGRF